MFEAFSSLHVSRRACQVDQSPRRNNRTLAPTTELPEQKKRNAKKVLPAILFRASKQGHPASESDPPASTCRPPTSTSPRNSSPQKSHRVQSPQPAPRPPNPPRQLNVLLHNRHPLRVDRAQIRILKQVHQERFGALLQRLDRLRLPSHAFAAQRDGREGDFADLCREGCLAGFVEGKGKG